jgi:hypothetical protein
VWGRKGVIVSQLDDTTTPMVVNAFKGLPVPMVALYQKNFNMSGDAPWMTVVSYKFGTKTIKGANYFESGTQLTIADPTHPLAAGLSGTVTVATAGGLHWGAPQSAEAIKVASVVGVTPPGYGIFAYPPGATMDDGSKAAGARVGLFFDPSNGAMTAEGWKLLEAALDWAASQ